MEKKEIKEVLESFTVLVDTREHDTPEFRKRCEAFGVPWKRAALNYGDYSYTCILPGGKELHNISRLVNPLCAIERKEDLTELSGNLSRHRERFKREFERARATGAKMYLLVEGASWESLINGRYRSKFHPNAYFASIIAFMARYDLTPLFCKPETAARVIKGTLFYDLKERLERGELDNRCVLSKVE